MNKLLRLSIINFFLGGFFVSLFATLTERYSYGLSGNLIGALPIMTTYLIFYSYVNGKNHDIDNLLQNASLGAMVYIIFNIAFLCIYPYIKNIYGTYFIALGIWIACQLLLIGCILPQFNIKLFSKKIKGDLKI